jgi:hypothetical protein
MRDAPPTVITGPTLVFDSVRKDGGTFVCSLCRTDFHTSDPVRAFALFTARQHKCAPYHNGSRRSKTGALASVSS